VGDTTLDKVEGSLMFGAKFLSLASDKGDDDAWFKSQTLSPVFVAHVSGMGVYQFFGNDVMQPWP